MPSLSFEMLRVVTGTDTIFIKIRQGRHQEHRRQGIPDSDRPQRPALGAFCAPAIPRSMFRRPTCSTAALRPKRSRASWCWSEPRRSGSTTSRPRRSIPAMPGVEIHAQVLESALTQCGAGAAVLRPGAGIRRRADARTSGDRVRADVRAGHPGRGRRAVRHVADRNVLVFLHPAPAADRFHLSAAVDHLDLSHPDLLQLRARAGAAAADPLGVRPVSVAGAGRAAGAVAGKARARRRGARDDHHVLRRPRLHHHLGVLQARSAGPDRADEPVPDAADQCDPGAQGHHRQIHGRRHHGVLECAARRQASISSMPAKPRSTCWSGSTS